MRQRDEFKTEEIEKLKVKVDCANLVLKEGNTDSILVEAAGEDDFEYSCKLEFGKLKIRQKVKDKKKVARKTIPFEVIVTIPAGKKFEKVSIGMGAGKADLMMVKLDAKVLQLEAGAGNVVMGKLNASEECKVETGAGNVRIEKAHVEKMKINCGVGNFEMTGKIEKNLDADCGVGNIGIHLEGKEEDYNYETSCGIGKIKINGSSSGRLGAGKSWMNPDAVGTIRLNCGVGKIDLTTI